MNDSTKQRSPNLRRRFLALETWRFSESILLTGVFSLGVVILAIHLATWGIETRRDAKLTTPVDCVVVQSVACVRADENGTLFYRPEIRVQYEYDDETFVTSTYDRQTLTEDQGFVYTRAEADAIVAQYPSGTQTVCWIRVDDPTQAVLVRNSHVWGWIFLIIPTSLILFGGALLIARLHEEASSREALANERRQKTRYPTLPSVPPSATTRGQILARRLTPDVRSSFAFGASAFGALVWNLASWIAFAFVLASAQTALDRWLAWGFCVVFCGIGLLFACRLWGQYRVERVVGSVALEISELPIVPGRKVKFCLFLKGRVEAKRLDVFLRCEEVARFVQGTNSIVNRHEVFSRAVLTKFDVDVPAKQEERETFTTSLPLGVAPSFVAEHNELAWKAVVRMEFADGGTFTRDFDVVVLPFLADKYAGR